MNTERAAERERGGPADAARPSGRRRHRRDLRAAFRTSACRPCSSTPRPPIPARAPSSCATRRASPCSSIISFAHHGHDRIAYIGPPARRARPARRRSCTARGASASTASARPPATPAWRSRRSTCGRAIPPARRRTRSRSRASCSRSSAHRERSSRAPTRSPSGSSGRARGRRPGPGRPRVVSFDEPANADLLDPPMTSLDPHDRELGRRAARAPARPSRRPRRHVNGHEIERVPCGCARAAPVAATSDERHPP